MRLSFSFISVFLSLIVCHADNTTHEIDPKGYVVFCPCMGRFGNQADHYLGAIAFTKGLDRTLILPPWVEYPYRVANSAQINFDKYFCVDAIAEYLRVVTMADFMENLAPRIWPEGQRIAFCYTKRTDNQCRMKEGNPFGPFWDNFKIDFDSSEEYRGMSYSTENPEVRKKWDKKFPATEYPVLAFGGAPAPFPVEEKNLHIQKYFKWSKFIDDQAEEFIKHQLPDGPFVGIHLRNGLDWDNACQHVGGSKHLFASPQCLGYNNEKGSLTQELCKPSRETIKKQLKKIVKKIKAKSVFVATDSDPMISELEKVLKIRVVQRTPSEPHVDLAILGKSDHYIGNCVSSFSAFAKRERDVLGKPSSFWAFKATGKREEL